MNRQIRARPPQSLIHKLQTVLLQYTLPLVCLHSLPQLCHQLGLPKKITTHFKKQKVFEKKITTQEENDVEGRAC